MLSNPLPVSSNSRYHKVTHSCLPSLDFTDSQSSIFIFRVFDIERQRVNIARALMNRPAVLIVDEPTSALDQERGTQIIDLLLRLTAEHGTATMLVTHEPRFLPRLTSAHTMVDGRLRRPTVSERPEEPRGALV